MTWYTSRPSLVGRIIYQAKITRQGRSFGTSTQAHLKLAYDLYEPSSSRAKGDDCHPIVFLHGLFGSKKNNRSISKLLLTWDYYSRVLARDLGRPVFALDLRNHGESPHDRHHDYTSMASDVAGFIIDHNLDEPTIIGHSMGAKTAMALALRSPDLVRNIISVDNAPVDAVLESGFGNYVEGMKRIERAGVMRQAEADEILKNHEESLPVRQFLLANLYRPQPNKPQQFRVPLDILGRSLGHMADFPFKNPEETRFEKPALFIRGTRSKYVADDVLPLIGQFFPRFRLIDVDAGHWLISENPEAFREAVVDFLSTSK
ncbi:hypothetical protein BN1708_011388 [Verticillium longisporum]|uniref:AB hydrolase-1 domain-containing protein n=2 Tax=Verticillium longisporum TaxID=100787 RepID=A0A0G4L0K5_VERLO|nr:hypothetical protein BN1708_011388 [Verticillium longisporum]